MGYGWINSLGELTDNAMRTLVIVILAVYGVLFAWTLTNYILRSIGLFTVAKRRGLANYGLAWVPVGYLWTVGGIADDYDSTHGVSRKWRHALLWLALACGVLCMALNFVLLISVFSAGFAAAQSQMAGWNSLRMPEQLLPAILAFYLGSLPLYMLSAAKNVCTWICYYKLFESCNPKKSVLLLLLSLLVPFAFPFCLLSCCRKDLGMPSAVCGAPGSACGGAPELEAPVAAEQPAEDVSGPEEI